MQDEHTIALGRVGRSHGIKGQVRVHSWASPMEGITAFQEFQCHLEGEWLTVKIDNWWRQPGGSMVASVRGYRTPEDVKHLTGGVLHVPRHLLTRDDDEVFWHELEGMDVVDTSGSVCGTVTSLMETGSNDVLVVKTPETTHLIPWLMNESIVSIDQTERRIVVDWDTYGDAP